MMKFMIKDGLKEEVNTQLFVSIAVNRNTGHRIRRCQLAFVMGVE